LIRLYGDLSQIVNQSLNTNDLGFANFSKANFFEFQRSRWTIG